MTPKVDGADLKRVKCELARRSFWQYCKLKAPEHYKPERRFLKRLCNEMQSFLESDDSILVINGPPRHYKTFTATSLCEWWIGNNPESKIMTGAYNEILSEMFSKGIKGTIETAALDPDKIVYRDIFPNVRIKRGDGAVNRWSLEGRHATYLSTSPTGTATGFGANLLVIDDIIRSALEANNAMTLERHWIWLTDTMISRLEEGGKIVVVMTRWTTQDLAGRIIQHYANMDKAVRVVTFKALQDDGTMLCEDILSRESYEERRLTLSPEIASANYQQEPIDVRGKLYSEFKTYDEITPRSEILCYCDTADEGNDYLCAAVYTELNHEAYILEIYYTKEPMRTTEQKFAKILTDYSVDRCTIESNNGGLGFARAVRRELELLGNYRTVVRTFTQTKNKTSRILTASSWVVEHIYFPKNWMNRWRDFHQSMVSYQREGSNLHDDAEDCITAVAESMATGKIGLVNVKM